jgi:hypothetical protein
VHAVRVRSSSVFALHVVNVSPGFRHVESECERCQRWKTTYANDTFLLSVPASHARSVYCCFLLAPEHIDVGPTITCRPSQCGEPCAVCA